MFFLQASHALQTASRFGGASSYTGMSFVLGWEEGVWEGEGWGSGGMLAGDSRVVVARVLSS